MNNRLLRIGDPVPWFKARTSVNPEFTFASLGGHYTLLCCCGDTRNELSARLVDGFLQRQEQLAALGLILFALSLAEIAPSRAAAITDPVRVKLAHDADGHICTLLGSLDLTAGGARECRLVTYLINPVLQVAAVFPVVDADRHAAEVLAFCRHLPPPLPPSPAMPHAPVLRVPNVLSPEECNHLVGLYRGGHSHPSGFMREVDGRTVQVHDPDFKRRHDFSLAHHPDVQEKLNRRLLKRVAPFIERAFQFRISRFERYLVSRYAAETQAFFLPHRDNTSKGTVHRRFAMSLGLCNGLYEGGHLRFPEYGTALYRPALGEAIIFSCSLLHEVTPITRGERLVLLSFFYNDEDALLREANRRFVALETL